ncbi:MAG: DUF3378 domain-containing protein [Erysipelotrichaceae bacterium]|nr:DUF3378 domain-containing protein [Erysipelotrichaceae bacterium]
MGNFSFKLDSEKIAKLKETFHDYIKENKNEYVDTFIQKEDLTITIYKSGKTVFQGNDAFFYASAYLETKKIRMAGSDEVGTGDVFGPVVVCSAIVEEADYPFIEENHITDSKALPDDFIRKIGPKLRERFKHSLLILDDATYNRVHETDNLNAIKARMHNKAYLNMLDKGYDIPKAAYVDQFCSVDDYYRYLAKEKRVFHDLIFETKAESKYPAVAIGSMISRYAFLEYMDALNKKYAIAFQRGATETAAIDEQIRYIIERFGKDELKNIGKLHFKNFEKYR